MLTYRAPVEDTLFLLNDVVGIGHHADIPAFADLTADVLPAIISEAARFSEDELQPLNRIGDRVGCLRGEDGAVKTPPGFAAAYKAYADAGWVGLAGDPAYGGQGLPYVLAVAVNEYAVSANMAFAMYPGLTQGAIAALTAHGSDAIRAIYLPKMTAGRWTGTMNLTEPHCGTDLGLIRTRATATDDGSYRITGTKIFISAGEHDMAENIVHLVLARIEGSPEGVKGISLFVVPKYLPGADGNPGERNKVSCGSIEEKMGIHGNATCVMNYDGATGWLVGEVDKGLRAMFTMMNEARLGVGLQGLSLSEVAYQNAVAYARDRRQGRALIGAKEPTQPADPIIVHPDVRRTLLTIRAFNEGARALVLDAALKSDLAHRAPDEATRQAADDYLGLMTPVIKGFFTDRGFDNTVAAQQMFGGHGYIAEWGMEQFVRDARIAMIYEGANGIQALDLVGRKLPLNGGRAILAVTREIAAAVSAADPALESFATPLGKSLEDLNRALMWLMQNGMRNPDAAAAGSTDFLHLLGLVMLGRLWLKIAAAVHARIAAGTATPALRSKLVIGQFFMTKMLPETRMRRARIEAGSELVMALGADEF